MRIHFRHNEFPSNFQLQAHGSHLDWRALHHGEIEIHSAHLYLIERLIPMSFIAKRPALIFTDLEGTLLDYYTRDWQVAKPALAIAREYNVPVIPCSSKTFEECLSWVKKLKLDGPFIFENGGGIALPKKLFVAPIYDGMERDGDYWLHSMGENYALIRQFLGKIRSLHHFQFAGFGDMSLHQISVATGLTEEEATLAKMRRYTEPLLWLDTAKAFEQFSMEVSIANFKMTRGEKFVHITGIHDKGKAMLWLAAVYYQQLKKLPFVIAAGDSHYDMAMLKLAHAAVIIRPPNTSPLTFKKQTPTQIIITPEAIGPSGWNKAIHAILTKLYLKTPQTTF